jgi:aryl carrier-like protein
LLSRSGLAQNERAIKVVEELRSQGVEVRCEKSDISDLASLKQALDRCSDMPPVQGCFHAAMAIKDSTFSKLTLGDWRECTLPKIQGSWNLHVALPSTMDFFILLSSACGVFGNAGQCSYAGANTFLDALAQFRTAQGKKTVALDLGILLGEGYVAENKEVMTKLLRMNLLAPTPLEKVFAMFDYYCKPDRKITLRESQLCSGYELPVNAKAKGLDVHTTMLTPLFRHMHQIKSSSQLHSSPGNKVKNFRSLFIEAATLAEAQAIASEGLQMKLSRVLGLSIESIELDRHLESYGVDSLVALELRNWMTKEMGADVAVFELLGGSTLADIGATIAAKTSLRKTI